MPATRGGRGTHKTAGVVSRARTEIPEATIASFWIFVWAWSNHEPTVTFALLLAVLKQAVSNLDVGVKQTEITQRSSMFLT